jgi:8-oxo-dGTP diphosphatase
MKSAKKKKSAERAPILSAGGIVLRGKKPLFGIVQLRGQKTWVLPKGKLHKRETMLAAARREATEETGYRVSVHEYLGRIDYISSGGPKCAKFWRMEAHGKPGRLMHDVQRVAWLPLGKATAKLSRPREREFLERVGPQALAAASNGKKQKTSHPSSLLKRITSGISQLRIWRYLLGR